MLNPDPIMRQAALAVIQEAVKATRQFQDELMARLGVKPVAHILNRPLDEPEPDPDEEEEDQHGEQP